MKAEYPNQLNYSGGLEGWLYLCLGRKSGAYVLKWEKTRTARATQLPARSCVEKNSAAGNRTRVIRVTGGYTNHYTIAEGYQ